MLDFCSRMKPWILLGQWWQLFLSTFEGGCLGLLPQEALFYLHQDMVLSPTQFFTAFLGVGNQGHCTINVKSMLHTDRTQMWIIPGMTPLHIPRFSEGSSLQLRYSHCISVLKAPSHIFQQVSQHCLCCLCGWLKVSLFCLFTFTQ